MTAPYDIDPKNESWTYDEAKLRKKSGWSKQYSAAMAGNAGWLLWNRIKPVSNLALGSNPTPGKQDYGGCRMIWHSITGTAPTTIDTGLDWRDRMVIFQGYLGPDTAAPAAWGSSSMSLAQSGAGADAQPAPDNMRVVGNPTAVWVFGYTKNGASIGTRVWDSGGTAFVVTFYSEVGAGNLRVMASTPPTNTRILSGLMWFSPQTGYRDT